MSESWKEVVNEAFVSEDGQRRPATVSIHLSFANGIVQLPPMLVKHTDSLHDIFMRFSELQSQIADNDKDQINSWVDNPIPGRVQQRLKAINVEHLEYEAIKYLVYRMADDSFIVRKEETGEELEATTNTYQKLVEKYQKTYLPQP